MPDFGRIINMAYMRILGRPADPGGQESYDRLMNQGMTEAMMRESLLRSPEYAANNPDMTAQSAQSSQSTQSAKSSSRSRSKTKKKSKTKRRKKKSR